MTLEDDETAIADAPPGCTRALQIQNFREERRASLLSFFDQVLGRLLGTMIEVREKIASPQRTLGTTRYTEGYPKGSLLCRESPGDFSILFKN